MKIKLSVSDEHYESVKQSLEEHGIGIDDDAKYILSENDRFPGHLTVRDEDGSKKLISVDDIVTIESYGHNVEIHTADNVFKTSDRLYQLTAVLDPEVFLRVSNSVIIAKKQVREIIPTFSMKFILKMKNGSRVDVTRSYYSRFKAFFGI